MSSGFDDDDDMGGTAGTPPATPRFPGTHEVGYGRPPVATRFQPGQSGNPAGRPRGAKTRRFSAGVSGLRDAVVTETSRQLPVREAGEQVMIPVINLVMRKLIQKAAGGNVRAMELLFKVTGTVEREDERRQVRFLERAAEYKAAAEAEVARRRRRGADESDIVPHPEHLSIDISTGEFLVSGPLTEEERRHLDAAAEDRDDLRLALAGIDQQLAACRDKTRRAMLTKLRVSVCAKIGQYDLLLGEEDPEAAP